MYAAATGYSSYLENGSARTTYGKLPTIRLNNVQGRSNDLLNIACETLQLELVFWSDCSKAGLPGHHSSKGSTFADPRLAVEIECLNLRQVNEILAQQLLKGHPPPMPAQKKLNDKDEVEEWRQALKEVLEFRDFVDKEDPTWE
ncbi:hypothetical protein GIB67_027554 [Kingdonia uniflora]|uniref:Uncharacterized protein n=1 Tax=Kingdonia uniflora TaxID=39325 RepID=A0A7J7NKY1_9MAGN|nr:hypothetical protein GIB67_027554 [Kingdonia uniflora]